MKKFLVIAATLIMMAMAFSCALAAEDKVSGSVVGTKYENTEDKTTIIATGDVLSGKAEDHVNYGAFVKQKNDGSTSVCYGIDAGASASGTAVKGTYDGTYGSENNNVKGSASVEVGTVKASAGVSAGLIDGKLNAKVDVGVKAVAAGFDASVGGTISGVETKVKVGMNVGIGANMKFDCSDGKVSFEVGGSLGLGMNLSVEVDMEALAGKVVGNPKVFNTTEEEPMVGCDPFAQECLMLEENPLFA